MEDLTTTYFNDNQILSLINSILLGENKVSVITADEKNILQHRQEVINLNSVLKQQNFFNSLNQVLSKVKQFVPIYDGLFFLLEAQKLDRLDEGLEALDTVLSEERSMNLNSFMELLYDGDDSTPLSWKIIMSGEDKERESNKISKPRKSSIDLDRLKNFK